MYKPAKLMILVIFLVFAATAFGQSSWMTDNASLLGPKKLNEIAIPGAHDAGTFAISPNKAKGVRIGSPGETSPDNKKVKRLLSFGPVFDDWAKTQERTTAEMLADGIRYFDIRVCVDGKGVLMTCHGLYGAPVAAMLDDIKAFSDKYPREVVLIGFNHFWDRKFQIDKGKKSGEIEGMRAEKWTELVALVKSKLGTRLMSGKTFTPISTLNDVWKSEARVIALFDSADAPEDEFVWKQREENTWVEGWNAERYKAGTLKVLENAKAGKYEGKFFAVRSSVTPDDNGELISMGFVSKIYPRTVAQLADMTNPVALGWIKNEWAGKYPVNLIWCDFYNRADVVKLTLHLNGIKTDFKGSKIGTETNWPKLK